MRRIWPHRERGWSPCVYLVYLAFLFVQPVLTHSDARTWALTIAAPIVFLPLYLTAVWNKGPLGFWSLGGILALGYGLSPINGGASCFLFYASALLGFMVEARAAFGAIAGIIAGIILESWLLHLPPYYWGPTILLMAVIGVVNIHAGGERRANVKLRRAHDEIERLAKVAERERIARDMHDVLGHTLSVIVLKSELASRLMERDQQRARTEITEVEQIARQALSEVRQAIRGYRAGSLAEELARARSTLETAGIEAQCEIEEMRRDGSKLSAAQETVLALVVREAVTNVVRHSGARNCRILFAQEAHWHQLEIEDDGRGGVAEEGNGLRGMRERVEALQGTFVRDGARGMKLSIRIPMQAKQEAIA